MTLSELIDHNVAFDDGETRTVMSFDELIEMIGFVDLVPVLETLMTHRDFVTDEFTYSLTDDPLTILLRNNNVIEVSHSKDLEVHTSIF